MKNLIILIAITMLSCSKSPVEPIQKDSSVKFTYHVTLVSTISANPAYCRIISNYGGGEVVELPINSISIGDTVRTDFISSHNDITEFILLIN